MRNISELIKMSDNDLFSYLQQKLGSEVITDGENYLYLPSKTARIMLIAHIDTVCDSSFKALGYIKDKDAIINRNGILGADDRAGVYAILYLLDKGYDVSVLFTNYEETGAQGAYTFSEDIEKLPKSLRLLVELDRRGVDEYVTYSNIDDKVHEYIQSFGFRESCGSFSDIQVLTDSYSIPSVNLSVGYYNEHTEKEYLVLSDLKRTITKVEKLIKKPIEKLYKTEDFNRYNDTEFFEYDCLECGYDLSNEHDELEDCPGCGSDLFEQAEYLHKV